MPLKLQKGSSIILVLVLLVVMLFMGLALFHSTDISALISGNVAIKQAATQLSDVALAKAETQLNDITIDSTATKGYTNIAEALDSNGLPSRPNDCTNNCGNWSDATIVNNLSYRYLIERLCPDATDSDNCIKSAIPNPGETAGSIGGLCGAEFCEDQMYRVTVWITGPKNLESFVQSLYSK